jgi:hypothetical protein
MDVALPVQRNAAECSYASAQAAAGAQPQQQQQQGAAGAQASHQSLLVATHPTGLLLLQRDVASEAQHQSAAHQAAVNAWEAGGAARQAVLFGQAADAQLLWQQQQELLQGVQPLWMGQGEAAPWAGGGEGQQRVHAQLHQQLLQGAGNVQHAGGANRAGLAAEAAAAAGGLAPPAAATHVHTAREVGVYNPGADMAPQLMLSAACAPAPGISLMCTAQLGLHVQPLDRAAADGSSSRAAQAVAGSSLPVWCFSASGAVSIVQMLQPQQAQLLLQLQKRVEEQQQGQLELLQLQPALEQQQQQGQGRALRALARLPASASFQNYQRDVLRAAGEDEEQQLGFNCVDGDLLFSVGAKGAGAAAAAQDQDGRLLQHLLFQRML